MPHIITTTTTTTTIIIIIIISVAFAPSSAAPPPESIQCCHDSAAHPPPKCRLSNGYGVWNDRSLCGAAHAAYPATELELLAAVASASRRKIHMKAVTRWSYSIPKWACPRGSRGLLISTRNYTRTISIDPEAGTVTADSGVILAELIRVLEASGFTLPASVPYWAAVSLGGLISTGSHGSSLVLGPLHDCIAALSLVVAAPPEDGYARILRLSAHDDHDNELLNAAKLSLGLLGVISQITFRITPLFKRSITNIVKDDATLEQDIVSFGRGHEFGDITWHPSLGQTVYRKDDRAPIGTPGDGLNDFIGFRPQHPLLLSLARNTEEFFEKTRNRAGKHAVAAAQVTAMNALGTGLKNDGKVFTRYPVVGNASRMQASGRCALESGAGEDVCGWDPHVNALLFFESAFLIPLDLVPNFIADLKKLRDSLGSVSRICGVDLYYGILMRFVRKSSAYLGAPQDSVEVNFNYFRHRSNGNSPRLDEDVWEEVEQMARFKYRGLPSWAKNRDAAFLNLEDNEGITKFKEVMRTLDPLGLFSNEWSDHVFGIGRGPYTNVRPTKITNISTWTSDNTTFSVVASRHSPISNPVNVVHSSSVRLETESNNRPNYTCDSNAHWESCVEIEPDSPIDPNPTIPFIAGPFCALEGSCFCLEDVHCAPKQGYLCRNGLVYTSARVCRYNGKTKSI